MHFTPALRYTARVKLLDNIVFPRINDFILGDTMSSVRADVVGGARGRVLEIGAGTGLNFRHYDENAEVVAIEPAEGMRQRAQTRALATDVRARVQVVDGNAKHLQFDASSFDTVIVTFVFCSVDKLDRVLLEVHRVLRPGGTVRLVEHVKSPDPDILRWQTRLRPIWMTLLGGCDPIRDVAQALDKAGFDASNLREVSLPLPTLARAGVQGLATKA